MEAVKTLVHGGVAVLRPIQIDSDELKLTTWEQMIGHVRELRPSLTE